MHFGRSDCTHMHVIDERLKPRTTSVGGWSNYSYSSSLKRKERKWQWYTIKWYHGWILLLKEFCTFCIFDPYFLCGTPKYFWSKNPKTSPIRFWRMHKSTKAQKHTFHTHSHTLHTHDITTNTPSHTEHTINSTTTQYAKSLFGKSETWKVVSKPKIIKKKISWIFFYFGFSLDAQVQDERDVQLGK